MSGLTGVVVAAVGFTACAEFGSYAFVHPVVRRLPEREQVRFEQGLLGTFGRFMPVAMTLVPVLLGIWAGTLSGPAQGLAGLAAALGAVALVTTVAVNVGINRATGTWSAEAPPANWRETRRRWDRFQGLRSWLLLLSFLALAAAVALA